MNHSNDIHNESHHSQCPHNYMPNNNTHDRNNHIICLNNNHNYYVRQGSRTDKGNIKSDKTNARETMMIWK